MIEKIEIKNRWTGEVKFTCEIEGETRAIRLGMAVKLGLKAKANLRGSDLRGTQGLPVAPVIINIDAEILKQLKTGGTLKMSSWHTCETTHCRAGWACRLAGYAGGLLEGKTSPWLAGYLIYQASRPGVPPPDFFADNETAMKDLEESAAKYTV